MNPDMTCVWSRRFGPLLWGRVDALDEGWSHDGKLIRLRLSFRRTSIALLTRRRQYALYWSKP